MQVGLYSGHKTVVLLLLLLFQFYISSMALVLHFIFILVGSHLIYYLQYVDMPLRNYSFITF